MLSKDDMPSIALALTSIPPPQVFSNFNHDDFFLRIVLSRSEEIAHPLLVIWPLNGQVALLLNASGL